MRMNLWQRWQDNTGNVTVTLAGAVYVSDVNADLTARNNQVWLSDPQGL